VSKPFPSRLPINSRSPRRQQAVPTPAHAWQPASEGKTEMQTSTAEHSANPIAADPSSGHEPTCTGKVRRIFTTFAKTHQVLNAAELQRRHDCEVAVIDGRRRRRRTALHYLNSQPDDLFVFNGEVDLISLACLLKILLPGLRGKIVAVDMVLRKPTTAKARIIAKIRSFLWKRVDLFIHYFKNIEGFSRYYGITASKSVYVPFKSNILSQASAPGAGSALAEGEYVFSAGRSLRDYETLIAAARKTGLPFAILFTSEADWAAHGTFVDLTNLPPNLRLIHDDGSQEGWINGLKQARIVVVPTQPDSICASGIGTYLDAMALGKPVVITRGPGADDVLNGNQAAFVQPRDPEGLAQVLQSLSQDDDRRMALAEQGRAYAHALGGERELLSRIFAAAMAARD
jgi:glycosyltransferase involved in cell wall biosynthesis